LIIICPPLNLKKETVCKQHATMFKHDPPLERFGTFHAAKLSSIKQIRLVRLSKKNYVGNCTITLKNSNEDVMYEAVTDTNDSSYLVTLDQIYDIVGEEDWIHGDGNCLVNLASSQMIILSWGAKKMEPIEQRSVLSDEGLQVGDHVVVENNCNYWPCQAQIIDIDIDEGLQVGNHAIVENHGKHWTHKAQIINIDMETNIALIRWETTQKVNLVHLKDLK
jgi:hypothetical protein